MIVPVSSNILSTFYIAVFDITLHIILSKIITSTLTIINNHFLSTPPGLLLSRSRLDNLNNYGLSTKRFSQLSSLFGILALILTIMGSFSIDGQSRQNYVPTSVPLITSFANSSSSHIDFSKHVSPDGSLASATFVAASHAARCWSIERNRLLLFPAINNFTDLDSLVLSPEAPENSTCVTEESGFEQQTATTSIEDELPPPDLLECQFSVDVSQVPSQQTMKNIPVEIFFCSYEIVSTVASSHSTLAVLIQVKNSQRFWLIPIDHRFLPDPTPVLSTIRPLFPKTIAYDEQIMNSLSYLRSVGTNYTVSHLLLVAQMNVRKDGTVLKYNGEIDESEINVVWLITTAGIAVGMVLVAGIVRIVVGILYRNSNENGLNSAMDCIEEASKIAGEEGGREIWIGFRREGWSVGPVGKLDLDEGLSGVWGQLNEQTVNDRFRVKDDD